MIDGLYVIGTSRPCGKTLFCRALAHHLRHRNLRVGVMKPIDTGCPLIEKSSITVQVGGMEGEQDVVSVAALKRLAELAGPPPATLSASTPADSLEPRDAPVLARAADFEGDLSLVNLYRFAPRVEPAVAARLSSVTIDLELITAAFEQIARASDFVLVEGDACAMTPLSPDHTQLDLMERLGLPVLLIAPSRRGVIDAALPALEVLRNRRLKLAGVVFNRLDQQLSLEEASYPFQVEQFFGPVVRGVLPHFDAAQLADLDHLASRLQVHVDLDATFRYRVNAHPDDTFSD